MPLLVVVAAGMALSMAVPALHAVARDDHSDARAFTYWAVIGLAIVGVVGLATARRDEERHTRDQLLALVGTFALLPLLAAAPLSEAVPDTRFVNLYIEMTAALTTTGGSLYEPDRLSSTVHLWRALVGWQGGLVIWIAAVAILAPLRLGGFEVTWSAARGQSARLSAQIQAAAPGQRVRRYGATLAPVYAGLTLVLWGALSASGMEPSEAAIRAMATMSTSGIVGAGEAPGIAGEVAIFLFLCFAVTRLSFAADLHRGQFSRLATDRELRLAAAIVGGVTAALLARHWIGAVELRGAEEVVEGWGAALRAAWGTAFTVLSFLTTTGYESAEWTTARAWSGLDTPGVLLVGLAVIGGGVATTAGGVKLLRVYALYAHGRHEMDVLVHPHSVGAHSRLATHLPSSGVEAAWVFFMLFAVSIAGTTLGLGATGLDFRAALVLAIATLTTCGPLVAVALEGGAAVLDDGAKAIVTVAMIVGRLEALALIALFNPAIWRR